MSHRSRAFVCLLSTAIIFSTLSHAIVSDRIQGTLNVSQTVTLGGNVHHKALPQYDQGPADPAMRLGSMTLLTTPTPAQQKALTKLLAEQEDRKSPNYHKWLTPEQWADRFGLTRNDIQQLTEWLKSQGFTIGYVARGRNWITFSGTAAQVEAAFGTPIHRYKVDGEMHVANSVPPRIPAALAGIVTGIRGLHDFHLRPMTVRNARAAHGPRSNYYDNLFQPPTPPDFLAPGDIATIYDVNALYSAGIDGTGQKLAVVGQTDIFLQDINDFRGGFGLTAISGCTSSTTTNLVTSCNTSNFKYVLVTGVTDPGTASLGDLTEADLDLEWSGAVARNAQIVYVNAPATFNSSGGLVSGGVWEAWYFAVDNDTAPVISLSYGLCEFGDNAVLNSSGQPLSDEVELQKANSEGITFLNSTGDSGAGECDAPTNSGTNPPNLAVGGLAVSYPASSPEVTGVGGTAVSFPNGFSSTYWGTTNGTDGGSAQNPPIPETSWNDDEELAVAYPNVGNTQLYWQQNFAIVSTGGGPSNCAQQSSDNSNCVAGFPQPSWQTVTIPNQASVRFSPDVSLVASPNFPGYIFCTPQEAWLSKSTSTSSTCSPGGTTGIQNALALTDPNNKNSPAPSLVGGTSASTPVFAGMVTLLNQYLAGSSSAGLGNINPMLYELAGTPSNGAFNPVTTGDNNVYCEPGTPATPWPAALSCPVSGIFGYSASNADSTTGYNLVTGLGSVNANKLAVAWKTVAAQPGFSLSLSTTSFSASAGGSTNSGTITITPLNGFSGSVTFTCAQGLPAGATCNFVNVSATSTTLTIQASASMAPVSGASVIVTGTSGSVSSSAAISLSVSSGNQSFTLAPQSSTFQVKQGTSANVTVTLTPVNGFNSPVTYTCSDAAPASTCTGPVGATNSATVSFSVTTTAPTALNRRPLRGTRIFYASILGLLGFIFVGSSRKQRSRIIQSLCLIAVLGLSTMWLSSCGGSNSGGNSVKNPGTPAGSYTITVSATTGGTNPITASTTFQLEVIQ